MSENAVTHPRSGDRCEAGVAVAVRAHEHEAISRKSWRVHVERRDADDRRGPGGGMTPVSGIERGRECITADLVSGRVVHRLADHQRRRDTVFSPRSESSLCSLSKLNAPSAYHAGRSSGTM